MPSDPIDPGLSALRVPTRSVLVDDLYQSLKDGLLSNQIAPGSRLNIDHIARELHVSNTPVREALGRLESDGLVTKEPHRGFIASRLLDSHVINDLYDFRLLVEPPTAARAAARRDQLDFADLEALCDRRVVDRLLDNTPATDEIAQRDVDFHTAIARHAGNDVVSGYLVMAVDKIRFYTAYHRHGAGEHAWDEHRAIVAALVAGDPETAETAMREHLINSRNRLKEGLA